MSKPKLWMTIPVTTAVLLALAGCGGQDTKTSTADNTYPAVGEQTQSGSGGADFSGGTKDSGTDTTGTTGTEGSAGSGTSTSNPETVSNGQAQQSSNDIIQDIRSQLKMKNASFPTSFSLEKGKHLTASITSNTSDAFHINFYSTDQPVAVNDASLTASGSKVPVLASYEVKTYKDPNSTDISPDTDLNDVPKDMTVDLGHGIKGMTEGAAGSQYLTWTEGRWTLQIRSVSQDNMNNPGIAKKMVEYLESHTLPVPKEKGFVNVEYPSGGKSVNVTISWQEGKQNHQLQTEQVPLEALGMVVSVK
ncbi:hypothetical protein QP794_11850 [Paenibacillus sp. UMB7766-LJ446]|uniref:hypothetical protein n=1 Tax=Paenibacillus sp. UMB7766-LJ446 TaxID=3046313 RepID=UPI00254DB8D4|nr:hypothetical protein [Paenibacillus sp. UMB7766-LJ446]MDK8190778.1 hypothetical protein [Paenibacillus sp. UMB7766-LJ446]